MDLRLFAHEDADTCLVRRLRRDIVERGRNVEMVLNRYLRFVKPSFTRYIQPSMVHADIIVPRAGRNEPALRLLVSEINARVSESGDPLA